MYNYNYNTTIIQTSTNKYYLAVDTAIFTFLLLTLGGGELLPLFLILNKILLIKPFLVFFGGDIGVNEDVLLDRRR